MIRTLRNFWLNPIIVKELRSRMRGWRTFATLTGILVLLGAVNWGLYQIALISARYSSAPLSPQVGQTLFLGLVFMELFMVCGITPAVTAGAISSEHEKLTYEMLLATPLRPASILWGKLISSLSYVFLLLFAAVPMASLVFIFGGVALWEMVKALVILLVVTVMFGMLGLFMSALFGRTGRATVLSYLVVIVMLFAPLFLTVVAGILRQGEPPRWLLLPSPISALSSALASSVNVSGEVVQLLGGAFWRFTGTTFSEAGIPRPLYHYSLPLYGVITLVLYLLTTRLILPTRRWKIKRKDILVAAAALLVFAGGVAAAFILSADRYERATSFNNPPMPGMRGQVVMEQRAIAQPAIPAPFPENFAPGEGPGAVPEMGTEMFSFEDQASIYAAVIHQLYLVDHTFGDNPPDIPVLYLVRLTDDSVGDPNTPQGGPLQISAKVIELIEEASIDLPSKIVWVESREAVPQDKDGGQVSDGGAIITMGNIFPAKDGTVLVSASLYFGSLAATGKTYVLALEDGIWKVIGTTGVEWIS